MLQNFDPRLYQQTILASCVSKNCLVVLPTGLGKTAIALMLAIHRLKNFPRSKIIVMAPTKPLVEQHFDTFKKHLALPNNSFALFTGEIAPAKRVALWETATVIFSTPQGLENDVLGNRISLKHVSLLVFDEAHKATGDYSYVFLAKQYMKQADFPRILALTASPGADEAKIEEVCKNLHIEEIEARTEIDPDVQPYVQQTDVEWVKVDLPPALADVRQLLITCIRDKLHALKKIGMNTIRFESKTELLKAQTALQAKLAAGERDGNILHALSLLAEAVKAQHALELLETQCIASLNLYFAKLFEEAARGQSKAVKNLTADNSFKAAWIKTQSLLANNVEHPKLAAAQHVVKEEFAKNKKLRMILFAHYRDSAAHLHSLLATIPGVSSVIFVGQTKKGNTGLSQKQQAEILDQFRDGLYNVLIATSVAEEGLDIPSVDIVLFYEPIPSAIRSIQRRGRTGRQEKGRVIILVTKGTRDEAFSWSATKKEKKMKLLLRDLKSKITFSPEKQQTITTLPQEKVKIFADHREKGTGVLHELAELPVDLRLEQLSIGDYILSSRVAVEYKTTEDFVQSLIDGRLLEQLGPLKHAFERPLIIVEGQQDMYAVRNVHPNAIRGMLAAIAVGYGIPILTTKNARDTAQLLVAIAKREQEHDKNFSPHADRKPVTLCEQQEYLVSALPNVGPTLAKELLKHFGTIEHIFTATEAELKQVPGVGEKIAKGIVQMVREKYTS